ncbi:1,4-alpha-glucan-branching enzyme [Parasponia andersonii]|uniref:1,4-alpha-glucan-branching enzyme n=1 Tax=Parasponia andersonii TaxID=3476 RepID=A0A2P5BJW4_PARAD|nr:1,4-alpha-glucan-branching enzyme [Parasponia andersonii]
MTFRPIYDVFPLTAFDIKNSVFLMDFRRMFDGFLLIQTPNTYRHKLFHIQIEAAYAALVKVGFLKIELIVSEKGWASHGDKSEVGANVRTQGLITII